MIDIRIMWTVVKNKQKINPQAKPQSSDSRDMDGAFLKGLPNDTNVHPWL